MLLKVGQMDHDIEVDETTYSPVQKMYRLETKTPSPAVQSRRYRYSGYY